jgi:hypothetical protein
METDGYVWNQSASIALENGEPIGEIVEDFMVGQVKMADKLFSWGRTTEHVGPSNSEVHRSQLQEASKRGVLRVSG